MVSVFFFLFVNVPILINRCMVYLGLIVYVIVFSSKNLIRKLELSYAFQYRQIMPLPWKGTVSIVSRRSFHSFILSFHISSCQLLTTSGRTTSAKVRQDTTAVATKPLFTSVIIALFVYI